MVIKSPAEKARDARAQMLADALLERWSRVKRGREIVAERRAKGEPIGPAIVARFKELHRERLQLRWKLDRATFRFPDLDRECERVMQLCDEERSDALGQEWPGGRVQSLVAQLGWHAEAGILEHLEEACLGVVDACVDQLYGGEA